MTGFTFSPRHVGIALAVAVFLTATGLALFSTTKNGVSADLFVAYKPALSMACGHPFAMPLTADVRPTAGIGQTGFGAAEAFLTHEVDSFDCKDFPSDTEFTSLLRFQQIHRYAIYFFGMLWRIFGASWTSVEIISSLLFGISGLAVYGISRQFVSRPVSIFIVLMVISSFTQLEMLSFFRDYSRTPFILSTLFLLAYMVARQRTWRTTITLSLIGGLLSGIGFGFRPDAFSLVPLFVITVVLLVPSSERAISYRRYVPVLVFLIAFAVVAWPMFRAQYDDRLALTSFPRAKGLATFFNDNFGLETPFYENVALYRDSYSFGGILSHAARSRGEPFAVSVGRWGNDVGNLSRWSNKYYWDVARAFPADFVARSYASVLRTSTLPLAFALHGDRSIWAVRTKGIDLMRAVLGPPAWVPLLALAILFARNRRLAIYLLLLFVYFGLLSSVEFQIKHVFYLEPLFWISIGILLDGGWALFRYMRRPSGIAETRVRARRLWHSPARDTLLVRSAAATAVVVILLAALLLITRSLQRRNVQDFVDLAVASAISLRFQTETRAEDGDVIVRFEYLSEYDDIPRDIHWAGARYMIVTLNGNRCEAEQGIAKLEYSGAIEDQIRQDYSFQIKLMNGEINRAVTTLMFPAYFSSTSAFEGLRIDRKMAECLESAGEVPAGAGPSLTPYLTLNPGWERQPAYLRFQ